MIHMAVAHKPDLERFQKRKPKVVARRRYSVETKEEVLADLKLGKTVKAMSKKYGIPPGTMRQWARDAGIELTRVFLKPAQRRKAQELKALGANKAQVADILKVKYMIVQNAWRKL